MVEGKPSISPPTPGGKPHSDLEIRGEHPTSEAREYENDVLNENDYPTHCASMMTM
jgi:hypothetical protein